MKQTYFLITIFSLLSFVGCKKSSSNNPSPPTGVLTYNLQVAGGVGTGKYNVGDTAYVFSNPPATTQVFDKWTGDISNLASPNEWRSTLKMPGANVNVTATYRSVPAVTFTNVVINGSQVYYYVPAGYRGVLLTFHGTGGSAANWTSQQAENVNFCRYAAANGYALVITESKDRVNKMWDLSLNNNVDMANIDVILKSLQTSGIITAGKPLYGVGMSNGSAFCSLITYVKGYKASALYCYGGIQKVFPLSSVPTIWNMAVNDFTDDPNRQTEAVANYNVLLKKGVACQYYVNSPTPLYPSRFTIESAISSTGSTNIYNAFNTAGFINKKGFLTIDPNVDSAWVAKIPAPYNPIAETPIGDQLAVAYAQHKFYKDSNYRTIAFFNRF
jgi:hypothetical protein